MFLEMMILPRVIYIAKKKRLFDVPDVRKRHCMPIPRLGGISFTPVILLVGLLSIFFRFKFNIWNEELIALRIPEILLLVCGLLVIYLLGAKDDLVGVSFKKKFLVQFIASLFIIGSGVYINNFYGFLGIYQIPDWLGIPISVLFIIFTTNAINLIDGADGLASGITVVTLIVYGILFSIYGMWTYTCLAFITIGVLIPFFYYNVFHPTRKVFMGDTGSLTLGYLLAFMALRLVKYPPMVEVVPAGLTILVLSPLLIPLFDAIKVMIVRIAMGKGPFTPDRNHIHHKLIDLGFSKSITVLFIILGCVAMVILTWVLLSMEINSSIVFFIDVLLCILINLFIYRRIRIQLKDVSPEEDALVAEKKFSNS